MQSSHTVFRGFIVFLAVVAVVQWLSQLRLEAIDAPTSATPTTRVQQDGSLQEELPQCDVLMRQPNSPLANGDFITRVTTSHRWIARVDGSQELQLTGLCRLKRYTGEQARHCLANRHMNWIGDSQTRGQMISLAYLLHHGRYPPRFGESANCTHYDQDGVPQCTIINEQEAKLSHAEKVRKGLMNWGGGDDGGFVDGHFECECTHILEDRGGACSNYACLVENSYYFEPTANVSVSYVFETGFGSQPNPLLGFPFTGCYVAGSCRMNATRTEELERKAERHEYWSLDLAEALKPSSLLQQSYPAPVDIAIYNRGIWGTLTPGRAALLMPAFYQWSGGKKGRCFYKSTTANRFKRPEGADPWPTVVEAERSYVRESTYQAGCSFLDLAHLTSEFANIPYGYERSAIFTDDLHFLPWVFEELNNVLLNVLCNSG